MTAKVLVTGVNGQLGHDVVRCLEGRGIACRGVDIGDFDLTDGKAVSDFVKSYMPTTVVHCAAYTAVDKAEDDRETCRAVNVDGTRHVAEACRSVDAAMVYISTDYVFDGEGTVPFEVDAAKNPKCHYGATKALGEDQVEALLERFFIVRTAWVFGINGGNFVKTMLRLGGEREEVVVVADQIGSPTYTADLSELLCDMIATDRYGVYHATNEGFCSWYDFAVAIFAEAGLSTRVRPIATEEYPTKALRPKNSRLSKASLDRAGFSRLPDWRDALRRYVIELSKG